MDLAQRLHAAVRVIPDFPKPGISFKDITPLFLDPVLVNDMVNELAAPYADQPVDKVVGIESRGFLLGPMLAERLHAGFVLMRKAGKLPGDVAATTYDLEYGTATIELHQDALRPNERVVIHDDLLATGGTAAAAGQLVQSLAANVVGYSFLFELAFLEGRSKLGKAPVHVLGQFQD